MAQVELHALTGATFARNLRNLGVILEKGEAYAAARGFDPNNLVGQRLAPDMLPLSRQVQIACDLAKNSMARLAAIDPPAHPDTETTYAELKERVKKALAFVESVDAGALQGAEGRTIELKIRDDVMRFDLTSYVSYWALPNFYFHAAAVYMILRHNGVDLGKADFLGPRG